MGKKKEKKFWQQGDVLIKAIDALPAGNVERLSTAVLAEGEVTGHAHRIVRDDLVAGATEEKSLPTISSPSVEVLKILNKLYVRAHKEWTVKHEEHHPVTVPPGLYEIGIVREADHMAGVVRRVAD